MRGHKIILILLLAGAAAAPQAGYAQFSPRALLGALTSPLRGVLGRLGHRRGYHPRAGQEAHPSQLPSSQQFGDVGPVGWSSAYEDVLGYTFWPGRYVQPMRAHGFDVIADALMNQGRGTEVARATTGSAVESDSNGNAAASCGDGNTQVDWPTSQIDQDNKLDDAQRTALDKLHTAINDSVKAIKAGCTNLRALAPLDRLKATLQRLWAVRDAGVYIRGPLKDFYDSLSKEQKAGYEWQQKQPEPRANANRKPDNGAMAGAMARQYQACAAPSAQASERLLRAIEQEVQPTKAQDQAVQDLRKSAGDMAKLLTAPCAQKIPDNPPARLDAANDQLSNLSYAATSMEIALDGLYAQLDDAQKARFDSLGR